MVPPERYDSTGPTKVLEPKLRLVRGEKAKSPPSPPTTFDGCFRQYHGLVATIGIRMLGRRPEVDDYVQDVFFEVHKSFASLRDPAAIKGWVRSIAVRVAIKRLRRQRLAAAFGLDQPTDLGRFAVGPNQEHNAQLAEVYRALDGLPAKARAVWVLRVIEGEKLEDIATLTNMGLSSVKRHLTKAREHLQEVFGE